jgi:hypothetical protein
MLLNYSIKKSTERWYGYRSSMQSVCWASISLLASHFCFSLLLILSSPCSWFTLPFRSSFAFLFSHLLLFHQAPIFYPFCFLLSLFISRFSSFSPSFLFLSHRLSSFTHYLPFLFYIYYISLISLSLFSGLSIIHLLSLSLLWPSEHSTHVRASAVKRRD